MLEFTEVWVKVKGCIALHAQQENVHYVCAHTHTHTRTRKHNIAYVGMTRVILTVSESLFLPVVMKEMP